jgi:hypothetical protein
LKYGVMGWMLCTPDSYVEAPIPNVMVFRGGAFER